MVMRHHNLRLVHNRYDQTLAYDKSPANSEVDISADSDDLTEACRELLGRLPADLFAALKEAMEAPS
jgi:hypothetical protein